MISKFQSSRPKAIKYSTSTAPVGDLLQASKNFVKLVTLCGETFARETFCENNFKFFQRKVEIANSQNFLFKLFDLVNFVSLIRCILAAIFLTVKSYPITYIIFTLFFAVSLIRYLCVIPFPPFFIHYQ